MKKWALRILGPVDGHNFEELFENLNYAKKTEGPILLHVITKKGKGIKPAENDRTGNWHGTGPYKIETGDFVKPASIRLLHGVSLLVKRFVN